MKKIETVNAVGHVLCHDITRIVKDVVKDTPFRKGHVVTKEDIPMLLSLGKEHLYIWEKKKVCFMKMKQQKFFLKYVKMKI